MVLGIYCLNKNHSVAWNRMQNIKRISRTMDDSSSRFLLLKAILLHPQRPSIDLVTLERTPIVLNLYKHALPT